MGKRYVGLRAGVAIGALALALSPVLGLSAGASGNGSTWAPVQQGMSPTSVPGAVPFQGTPSNTAEQVSFILQERNESQLENAVDNGVRNFESVSQFARSYGQPQSNINQLTSYLSKFGIQSTVYADDVDVSTTGTAGEYDQALSVTQQQYRAPGHHGRNGMQGVAAQTFHGATSPQLPNQIAQYVLAVLGLTNYSPFTSDAVHQADAAKPTSSGGSGASACLALTGLTSACNTPKNFEQNYNLSPLESNNAGHGSTIGIVTLAALDVGAPEYYWSTIMNLPASNRTVTVQNVDGGPGAPSDVGGTGETDIDVEQSGGVAPGANVIVYQSPNTDSGFADAFFQAASQNIATDVSASWGESETIIAAAVAAGQETSAYQAAFDEAFLEFAAQGQSAFVSAGDSGAYDASGDLSTTNLSVDAPGDSPYVTSSGGTTLPWTGTLVGPVGNANVTVTQQRAWGWDYLWSAIASTNGVSVADVAPQFAVGGGGGYSVDEPTPSYQRGVSGTNSYNAVEYLTPTDVQNIVGNVNEPTAWNVNPTPNVTSGHANGRVQPDLSADADPESGYLLYEPSAAQSGAPALQGGWGGTSFVAPQLNGSTAVIDAALGHRVGFWNPSIYNFATSHNSPFTPLQQASTNNDNIFYTGNPGAVYNPATGLGVPNLAALAQDFRF